MGDSEVASNSKWNAEPCAMGICLMSFMYVTFLSFADDIRAGGPPTTTGLA